MTLRLLIDECLSPELVDQAIAAGHVESTCARDRGLLGMKDWDIARYAVEHNFAFVTHNARDFRGHGQAAPGGVHARLEIHSGLICLNSAFAMDLDRQRDLFGLALADLATQADLVNQALEVFEAEDGSVELLRYEIPAG